MCYHSDYYSKDYKNIHPWSLGYPSYCHDWKAIPHIGPYEYSFEYHRNDSFDLDFDCHAGPKKPCGLGYIEQIDKLKTVIEKLKSKISKLEAKKDKTCAPELISTPLKDFQRCFLPQTVTLRVNYMRKKQSINSLS